MVQIAIDTPDYQRGVISAQKLLATVAAGTASVTVGIPPNAETLIVTAADIADGGTIYAEGTSTLYKYSGVRLPSQPHMTAAVTWVFDVSNPMDEQVDVVFTDAPGMTWFVYADAAVHVIADASTLKDTHGSVYAVPAVPSTVAGDHPPDEVSFVSNVFTANAEILAAPGNTQRIRVFSVLMATETAGLAGRVADATTLNALCICAGPGNIATTLPAQGVRINENEALTYILDAGAGIMRIGIVYTIENV
jgi:hypothetical protein